MAKPVYGSDEAMHALELLCDPHSPVWANEIGEGLANYIEQLEADLQRVTELRDLNGSMLDQLRADLAIERMVNEQLLYLIEQETSWLAQDAMDYAREAVKGDEVEHRR